MSKKDELDKRKSQYKCVGKDSTNITYGMLLDGFRSLPGIPDDFLSAEDPDVRQRLWIERGNIGNQPGRSRCGNFNCGWCSICDPEYRD